MKRKLEYNGVSSGDFGLFLNGSGVYNAPEPDLEYQPIPGRNGDLIYDNGRYNNIEIVYPDVFALHHFRERFASFKAWINQQRGYHELTDDYQPDYFRLASVSRPLEVSAINFPTNSGSFDLAFNCMPQLFLKSGKIGREITAATAFHNPTGYTAKPLLDVYGHGTVTVGSRSLVIAANALTHIVVDCELQDCYSGSNNANTYVTIGDYFPELGAGDTTISFTGSISKIIVTPRWWTI